MQKRQAKPPSVSNSLSFQKQVMDHCDSMLECKRFGIASYSIILLIDICEKSFNSTQYGWKSQKHWSPHSDHVSKNFEQQQEEMAENVNSVQIVIGDYELSSPEEQAVVIHSLNCLFLKRLNRLMARIEAIAMAEGWQTQLSLIRGLMSRTQDAIMMGKESGRS